MAPKRSRKQKRTCGKRAHGGEIQFEYGGENIEANRAVPSTSKYEPMKSRTNYRSSNVQTIHQVLPAKQYAQVAQLQKTAQTLAMEKPVIAPPVRLDTYRLSNAKQPHKLNHYLARNTGTRKLFRK